MMWKYTKATQRRKAKAIYSELTIHTGQATLPDLRGVGKLSKASEILCVEGAGSGTQRRAKGTPGILCDQFQVCGWLSLLAPKLEVGPKVREAESY